MKEAPKMGEKHGEVFPVLRSLTMKFWDETDSTVTGTIANVHRLWGDDWTVWLTTLRVPRWPDSTLWPTLVRRLLEGVIRDDGALLAWCAFEGDFMDPPALFEPGMSAGVWAALCSDGRAFGAPELHEPLRLLSDEDLRSLREYAGFREGGVQEI